MMAHTAAEERNNSFAITRVARVHTRSVFEESALFAIPPEGGRAMLWITRPSFEARDEKPTAEGGAEGRGEGDRGAQSASRRRRVRVF
jgi:hypothetical protein